MQRQEIEADPAASPRRTSQLPCDRPELRRDLKMAPALILVMATSRLNVRPISRMCG
jgi:hypothetical protein